MDETSKLREELGNIPVLHGRWAEPKNCKGGKTPVQIELQESPFAEFASHFRMNFTSVCSRLAYLHRLENDYRLQSLALMEVIITQIAAMCVEHERHSDNYTIQVLLKRQKKKELLESISAVLSRVICRDCDGKELNVGMGIKALRNKFICHFDNFEDYDISGKENVGDGKWTISDRNILMRLLFVEGGHINDLVSAISFALHTADQVGEREIVEGAVHSAEMHCGLCDVHTK
ncbi:MAG: hypothetical protein J6T51_08110 [Kiritimatiellae bacterium]|nr:hypothetical protein [Kiritimatiellia bacterium]